MVETPAPLPRREPGRRAEDRFARLYFDYALTGILETDGDGTIVRANPAAASISGHSARQLVGKTLAELLPAAAQGRLARHLDLLREQGIGQTECPLVRPDGEALTLTLASVQIDEAHFMHVFDDVTEQRRAEAELRAARTAAEAANRAKDDFLANVSHEIRTPLNGIVGLGELALQGAESPQQRDYLARILQSGRTLLRLVNDLLDTARIEAGKVDFDHNPFPLDGLLADLDDLRLQAAADGRVAVQFTYAPELPAQLVGDRLRLGQCLRNLLGNALKFTPAGRIDLHLDAVGNGPERQLRCQVRDTGIGIDAAVIERLFAPFSQADASTTRRFGGSGLGLFITRELARGMGGDLTVTSAPGAGSCFTLQVPLHAAEPISADTAPESTEDDVPDEFAGHTVLLAEDNATNQIVASHWLARAGIHCLIADHGEAAIAALADAERAGTPPSLILMDVHMPVLDGLEATRRLRAAGCTQPIVGLTASVRERDRDACLAAGMSDFLGKPLDPDELWGCLTRWLPPLETPTAAPPESVAERFQGHAALLARARARFVAEHADDARRLQDDLRAPDRTAAHHRAHALRGAAATLGLDTLAAAAATLEEQLERSGAPAADAPASPDLDAHCSEISRLIADALAGFG